MDESKDKSKEESLNLPPNTDLAEAEIKGAPAKADQAEDREGQSDPALSRLRYEFGELDLKNQRLEDENQRLRDIHELRKEYIPKLFVLILAWLAVVVIFLWKVAEGPYFYLSDSVLITLITTTTINVLGIFLIAANWLFPKE